MSVCVCVKGRGGLGRAAPHCVADTQLYFPKPEAKLAVLLPPMSGFPVRPPPLLTSHEERRLAGRWQPPPDVRPSLPQPL